jgi:hypothetical protein
MVPAGQRARLWHKVDMALNTGNVCLTHSGHRAGAVSKVTPNSAAELARPRRRGDRISALDVRYWHKTDIADGYSDVCFLRDSGHAE